MVNYKMWQKQKWGFWNVRMEKINLYLMVTASYAHVNIWETVRCSPTQNSLGHFGDDLPASHLTGGKTGPRNQSLSWLLLAKQNVTITKWQYKNLNYSLTQNKPNETKEWFRSSCTPANHETVRVWSAVPGAHTGGYWRNGMRTETSQLQWWITGHVTQGSAGNLAVTVLERDGHYSLLMSRH